MVYNDGAGRNALLTLEIRYCYIKRMPSTPPQVAARMGGFLLLTYPFMQPPHQRGGFFAALASASPTPPVMGGFLHSAAIHAGRRGGRRGRQFLPRGLLGVEGGAVSLHLFLNLRHYVVAGRRVILRRGRHSIGRAFTGLGRRDRFGHGRRIRRGGRGRCYLLPLKSTSITLPFLLARARSPLFRCSGRQYPSCSRPFVFPCQIWRGIFL